jgi:hypothetical protein
MMFPFLLMSFEYLCALTHHFWSQKVSHQKMKSLLKTDFWGWNTRTFLVLMNMSYAYVIVESARPFSCRKNPNGSYTMVSSPDLDCYDQQWLQHSGMVAFFIFLYILVFPGTLLCVFFKFKDRIGTTWFNARFGVIVAQYKDELYFWELVILVKRAWFSIIANIIGPLVNSSTKLFLVTCLIFGFLVLEIVFLPYKSIISNQSNQL